jgi:hypothetical protein
MPGNPTDWFTIGDELLCGPASGCNLPGADSESTPGQDECVLRMVIQCREFDEVAVRKREYRVRFTNVIQADPQGRPEAESLYFDVNRGDLQVLLQGVAQAHEHAKRHGAGQLDRYVETLRELGGSADGPSRLVDLSIV